MEKQLQQIAAELQRLNRNLEKLINKNMTTNKAIKEMSSMLSTFEPQIGSEGELNKQSDK